MVEMVALFFWPIGTLLPCLFLVKWVHAHKDRSPFWDWAGALLGIGAMAAAWLSEIAITSLSQPSPGFWLTIFVPTIEESWRWIFLLLLSRESTIARATWLGAFMGAAETFLKLATTASPDSNPGFRMLATGPFHALLGGILWRGMLGRRLQNVQQSWASTATFLPYTILLHGIFNTGFILGTSRGYLVCLTTVWVAGAFWLYGAIEEGETGEFNPKVEPNA